MIFTGNKDSERNDIGSYTVSVDGLPLSPRASQIVINHSPDGFAWGYRGSGPAQLSLAILLLFVSKKDALNNYQDFKDQVIAKLPDSFILGEQEIRAWIDKKKIPFSPASHSPKNRIAGKF